MKVLLNPAISMVGTNRRFSAKSQLKETPEISPEKEVKLPGYNQVDTNFKQYNINKLSFKARVNLTNEKLLKEIAGLKLEKDGLLNKAVDSAVTDAKDKLLKIAEWALSRGTRFWGDSERWAYARKEAEAAGESAKNTHIAGHGSTWQFFHGDGSKQYNNAYNNKMQTLYWDYRDEIINKLTPNKSHYESIVKLANENEENKQKRIQEIDNLIAAKEKLISYQGLQDSVNEMLSAKGGVNDRIAGYQSVKDELNTRFVQLLAKSKSDATTEVPPAVILYGPTGTGKTTFLNGIRDQARDGGYAEVVDISSVLGGKDIINTIKRFLIDAKKRYFNENKRTIFLMNDAERIFAINESDAEGFGIDIDEIDRNMLRAYGNNYQVVADFKALLDDVSKPPKKNADASDPRSASTFFITTNYPHLIHPDLLSRDGKATKIAVGLASDYNLSEVLKFYFERMNDVADKIKAFKGNPNYREAINGLAGITDKGRANILKMMEDGTIDKLKVDYENMPYQQIAKTINPNTKEGAFSNDGLRVICQRAFLDYLEQDIHDSDYKDSFFKIFINSRRDINPSRLKKFNLIDRMIKDVEIDPNTIEQLILQKKMDMLSEKQANLLQYHITKINADLRTLEMLEQKEPLSAEQLKRKAELQELKSKIESAGTESDNNNMEDEF